MTYRPVNIVLRLISILSGELKQSQNKLKSPSFSTNPQQWYHTILPLCTTTKSLQQTKQTHAIALLEGYLPNSISVCASLILQYATFGDPSTSRILFYMSLPYSRSAFLWNTITRAYNIAGVCGGFETYNMMIRSGVKPDDHTFPFVLKVCTDYYEVWKGKEVHGLVYKLGFDSDVFVGNTLLRFYGECHCVSDAEKLFDEMPERDIVSWNTLMGVFSSNFYYNKVVDLFRDIRSGGFGVTPNAVTVVSLLPVCAMIEDWAFTSEVHGYAVKMGFDCQVTICNSLIDAYGKCGDPNACLQVFDAMVEKNDVSWNSVITSFAHTGRHHNALDFFRLMLDKGIVPKCVAVSSMLPVLVELEFFRWGRELHAFIVRMGMDSDIFVSNSVLDMYSKLGYSDKASNVFNKILFRNVVSWNVMVANYAQNGRELAALELVREMQAHGVMPEAVTLTNVLPACAHMGHISPGKEVHARSIRSGYTSQNFVSNALIDMYAKCGRLDLARKVFDVSFRDRISYNTLIVAYSRTSNSSESLVLFQELGSKRINHDPVSVAGALSACANMSAIKQGKEIHGFSLRTLFSKHLIVSNSILDLYTKSGRMDLARKVFDEITKKDVASWNTIIIGYGTRGEYDTAINLFEAMREDNDVKFDSISYIAVLSVCSHGGLVEKGKNYFEEMRAQNIEPRNAHYACMVDLLGRAGLMDEAVNMIKRLPIQSDANIWGSLLGACRIHGNIEVGRWAAEHLFKLKPNHSGYYTLLSNIYAEAGRWYEAHSIRELMKSRGVKKNPGFSWVQDQVHV